MVTSQHSETKDINPGARGRCKGQGQGAWFQPGK